MATDNFQSRKFLLTFNNPAEYKLTHEEMIRRVQLSNPDYFCLADEVATTGTPHTHLFIYSRSPIRFSTLKNRFPTAHIDKANGTVAENRDYIRKEGKWAGSSKSETNLIDTFEEYGEVPKPCNESNPDMAELIAEIEEGKLTYDIIKTHPKYAFRIKEVDAIRQMILSDVYSKKCRNIEVVYVFGKSGTGKTRGIFKKHHPINICRITSYGKNGGVNFDHYCGHPVVVFEEFASQVPIEEMLNYLDIYPIMLPARYNDKVACYTTVYITSNLPLDKQYVSIQVEKPETWKAFLRRINKVVEYTDKGKYTTTTLNRRKVIKND